MGTKLVLVNGTERLLVDGLLLLHLGGDLGFQRVSLVGDPGVLGCQFEGFVEVL